MNPPFRAGRRRVPSILRRRNNPGIITTAIVLLWLISPVSLYAAGDTVPVQVLSKHYRLIREKGNGRLVCTFPPKSTLHDRGSGSSIPVRKLLMEFHEGWHVTMDGVPVSLPVHCRVRVADGDGACTLQFDEEKRTYPLPFTLSVKDRNDPVTVVTEKARRYATDSACAEYGKRGAKYREALAALAHVILARTRYIENNHPGHEYRFCDLTHCQVYRGRTGMPDLLTGDRWFIEHGALQGPLLFHSRCGGHTMDMGVFGADEPGFAGVKDILYRTGRVLCVNENAEWQRVLDAGQVQNILREAGLSRPADNVKYDARVPAVMLKQHDGWLRMAPETFRLKINRVKGWNFIRSNNYRLEMIDGADGPALRFRGKGLGHNVGLCQHGALALAGAGYSRYEILEHYYRDIPLVAPGEGIAWSPYLAFIEFDMRTGKVIRKSHPGLSGRWVPPGSLWKIIVTLYLLSERQDLVQGYHFSCRGNRHDEADLPHRCWLPEGHGEMTLFPAVSHSCNMFFASLARKISYDDFNRFYASFCRRLGLLHYFPVIKKKRDWARRCAGLDFQVSLRVEDLVKVAMLVSGESSENEEVNRLRRKIYPEGLAMLRRALARTFTMGTAALPVHPSGPECNWETPVRLTSEMRQQPVDAGLWGKTSTVIDGTNLPLGYGMFLGGRDDRGILVILRKGNGHLAAQWGRLILDDRLGE